MGFCLGPPGSEEPWAFPGGKGELRAFSGSCLPVGSLGVAVWEVVGGDGGALWTNSFHAEPFSRLAK